MVLIYFVFVFKAIVAVQVIRLPRRENEKRRRKRRRSARKRKRKRSQRRRSLKNTKSKIDQFEFTIIDPNYLDFVTYARNYFLYKRQ